MNRNAFAATLASLLSAGVSLAQAQAPAAPPAPSLAPPASEPAAAGPSAPVGKVTQALQQKLEAMLRGNGLTSDEVARRAVKNSSQLAAKRRSIEATSASIDQVQSSFYPALTLSARYTRLSDIPPSDLGSFGEGSLIVSGDTTTAPRRIDPLSEPLFAVQSPSFSFPIVLNQYVLSAALNVPVSDYVLRMSRAVSGASQARAASELDERATRLSVARDARVGYYQWIRAQGMAFVGAQSVEQAKGHLVDANNAFQAGLLSKADVLRAQSSLKSAELFLQRASSNVELATARLRIMLKDPPEQRYEVGENILQPLAELPAVDSEQAAYNEAASRRLELKQLDASELSLRDQAAVARTGNYPRLDAQASAQYSNPNPRYFPQEDAFHGTWEASLVLSWTPTAIFGAQATTRGLSARAAELAEQKQALRDSLRLEVAQALSAAKDARFAVSVSEQALLTAEEGYRVRRELFRSGRGTLVEVTDSETELTRARLELVNAHVDLRIARVELSHVLGRDAAR